MFGTIHSKIKTPGVIALQILILLGLSQFGTWISSILHVPVPGSIVGMIVLFLLLKFRVMKLSWVDKGGDWLIREMLLFFVPSSVGIMTYGSLMLHSGVQILITIVTSTALVMLCTGSVADAIWRRRQSHHPAPRKAA